MQHKVPETITLLYQSILGRSPDPEGLASWTKMVTDGADLQDVVHGLYHSPEAHAYRRAGRLHAAQTAALDTIILECFNATQDKKLTVLDIGAQDLDYEDHIYQPLLDHGLVERIIGFEPLAEKAQARNDADPLAEIHPLAVGTGQDETFHINNFDPTSSMYPINKDLMGVTEGLTELETVRVETITTTRLDNFEMPGVIDLLKVDVQGYELPILRHGTNTLARTQCVHSEVEFQPIYDGQPLFGEFFDFMRAQGFDLADLKNQFRLASQNFRDTAPAIPGTRLFWADGVFTRPIAKQPTTLLPRRAAIHHFVFGWYDQTFEDLVHYDKTMNTRFGAEYAALLNG